MSNPAFFFQFPTIGFETTLTRIVLYRWKPRKYGFFFFYVWKPTQKSKFEFNLALTRSSLPVPVLKLELCQQRLRTVVREETRLVDLAAAASAAAESDAA